MTFNRRASGLLFSVLLIAGVAAQAQVSWSITIGPPPPIYEAVPMLPQGYVWAPGYWAWNNDSHVWVRGRSIMQRPGYRWEPDRWEQRGNGYYRQPGNWARDNMVAPSQHQGIKIPRNRPQNPSRQGRPMEGRGQNHGQDSGRN
jgi:hypothetical protein